MLHRHDISDKIWEKIEKKLPGSEGHTGRLAEDNRRFINAVFWILRTGAPWRYLPPKYEDWKNALLQVSSARSGRTRWKSGDWAHKRGRNTKEHVAVDAFCYAAIRSYNSRNFYKALDLNSVCYGDGSTTVEIFIRH